MFYNVGWVYVLQCWVGVSSTMLGCVRGARALLARLSHNARDEVQPTISCR